MEWTVGISLQCHNCGCVIKYKITGMIIHHIWVCQLFQRVGENLQSKLFWSVIQLGVPESVWWPLPPALQLSQSVLPGLNMLRPHSLSCFHGSDVQVGVPDGALFWMRKWWRGLIKKKKKKSCYSVSYNLRPVSQRCIIPSLCPFCLLRLIFSWYFWNTHLTH